MNAPARPSLARAAMAARCARMNEQSALLHIDLGAFKGSLGELAAAAHDAVIAKQEWLWAIQALLASSTDGDRLNAAIDAIDTALRIAAGQQT